jgi:hypothetical protein
MTAFSTTNARTSKLHRMDHDARIESAIADLESQDHLNIAATAKKKVKAASWGVVERAPFSAAFSQVQRLSPLQPGMLNAGLALSWYVYSTN